MNLDWNTLDVSKYSKMELAYIRRESYSRYSPPNLHMMYMFLALILIVFSSMFFYMHVTGFPSKELIQSHVQYSDELLKIESVPLESNEFPKYHKTGFWIGEFITFFGGLALIPIWWKKEKKSRKQWKEMESIRKNINNEINKRG